MKDTCKQYKYRYQIPGEIGRGRRDTRRDRERKERYQER